MHKHILNAVAATLFFHSPVFAQDSMIETSLEVGGAYKDSVSLDDKGVTVTLDDVKTLDFGLRAEREFMRRDALSLSGALSGQANFGGASGLQLNGIRRTDGADYRRLGVYTDVIARMNAEDEAGWTPFMSLGVGLVQDRVTFDDQLFKDLAPKGRFRAGVENNINDKATLGIGVGRSVKLD